jgi:hypothetical protein
VLRRDQAELNSHLSETAPALLFQIGKFFSLKPQSYRDSVRFYDVRTNDLVIVQFDLSEPSFDDCHALFGY